LYWNFTDILRPKELPFTRSDGTIIAEIGFGNGEFIEYLARSREDSTLVGIEVSQWCVTKAARRMLAAGLKNVRLLLGDARHIIPYAFAPGCVSEVYMNFPCPWPKRRHTCRRVTRPRFVGLIRGCLEIGGSFTLATDVDWYAEETMNAFAGDGNFTTGSVLRNPDREYVTKYERKWREMGRDTFFAAAIKTNDGPTAGPTGEDMEALATKERPRASGDLHEKLSSLIGENINGNGYMAMFRELFVSSDGSALISVISVDEGFEQHYYVRAVQSGLEIRGKIDPVGHPYRTPGVRASLKYISNRTGMTF
jgi:tRNA (guanine-N7-)-methyltransferase